MPTFARTRRPALVVALKVAAAALSVLAVAPVPAASAEFGGKIGTPGPAALNVVNGKRIMIAANPYTGGVGFATGGVKVGRSIASGNPQTVRAYYRLEYLSTTYQWVPMDTAEVSAELPVSGPWDPNAMLVLPGHEFFSPSLRPGWGTYRVMYTVRWWDQVTGEELGYWDIYPGLDSTSNNFCSAGLPNCVVYSEDIYLKS